MAWCTIVYAFANRHKNRLILPDQDILNALYDQEIKKIDELNYSGKFHSLYKYYEALAFRETSL